MARRRESMWGEDGLLRGDTRRRGPHDAPLPGHTPSQRGARRPSSSVETPASCGTPCTTAPARSTYANRVDPRGTPRRSSRADETPRGRYRVPRRSPRAGGAPVASRHDRPSRARSRARRRAGTAAPREPRLRSSSGASLRRNDKRCTRRGPGATPAARRARRRGNRCTCLTPVELESSARAVTPWSRGTTRMAPPRVGRAAEMRSNRAAQP